MDEIVSFGDWVRQRRRSLDLTQKQLAGQVACSINTLQKIERGERRPSQQMAARLAEYLQAPPQHLPLFLQVARGERQVTHLSAVLPAAGVSPAAPATREAPQPSGASPAVTVSFTAGETSPPREWRRPDLPVPLSALVGREPELAQITHLLGEPDCRLLTLTGPGGIGKTRLALEAARQLQASFADGAGFIPLVGVSSPAFIVPAIADALGFNLSGPADSLAQLFNFLCDKQLLLVLDNIEHLLAQEAQPGGGVRVLIELLQHAPGVKLLATSREQMHLQDEWVLEVQGLPAPQSARAGELEAASAAALFLLRARQARVGFTLTDEDRLAVQRICRLVQGLPLALELAAAWVRTLSCLEIADEIGRGLDFLVASGRNVPERHRSITAVFDHSWHLLSPEEQKALQQLSVFRGGFTREAAEHVAGAKLPLLSALVDKSLLWHSPGRTGRYELHELIRQYAAGRLHGDLAAEQGARDRHSWYFLTLLELRESDLSGGPQIQTFNELKFELDNIRAAWDTAVASQAIDLTPGATWPLYYYFELHQYFQEGEALFGRGADMLRARLAAAGEDEGPEARSRLSGLLGDMLTYQAFFKMRQGRNVEARQAFRESIDRLRPSEHRYSLNFALAHYGILHLAIGDYDQAAQYLHESLPLSRAQSHPWLLSLNIGFLGALCQARGDTAEAYRWFAEAMAICRRVGDPHISLLIGTLFSQTALALGRPAEAEDMLREGFEYARQTGDRWSLGLALERMALLAEARGEAAEARRLLEEATAVQREVGDWWSLARALNALSRLAWAWAAYDESESFARDALKAATAGDYVPNALEALTTLAGARRRQGEPEPALEMALFVLSHPASPQAVKDRAGALRAELEATLTPERVAAAEARAQVNSFESFVREFLPVR